MIEELRALSRLANLGGWIFTDAIFLAAQVSLDRTVAAGWLPGGLALTRPATATLFVAHYPSTSFGSVYSEAGLFVDVRHWGCHAAHCPWMLVDDDVALILGREALGYPKKLGRIALDFEGDQVRARVERRGSTLFELDGTVGAAIDDAPPMLGRPFRNVHGTLGLLPQRLVSFQPTEEILEARSVSLELRLTGSQRDPLGQLGIGEVGRGILYKVNIGGRGLPVPVRPVSPLYAVQNHVLRYL